eukprot:SAG31_NODE_1824_length_7190_cov_43.812015_4_plen_182_part_00
MRPPREIHFKICSVPECSDRQRPSPHSLFLPLQRYLRGGRHTPTVGVSSMRCPIAHPPPPPSPRMNIDSALAVARRSLTGTTGETPGRQRHFECIQGMCSRKVCNIGLLTTLTTCTYRLLAACSNRRTRFAGTTSSRKPKKCRRPQLSSWSNSTCAHSNNAQIAFGLRDDRLARHQCTAEL